MSHYTVAVFTTDEFQSIDDLLAPYDEGIATEPYVDMTKEELIRHQRKRLQEVYEDRYILWKKDPKVYEKTANPAHIEYLKSLPEQMKWTDDQIYECPFSRKRRRKRRRNCEMNSCKRKKW